MRVTFYGVRGSIPAPGPETIRYGGNTACVAVQTGESLLILDSGTGITRLGRELMQGAFGRGQGRAALLLTHAHWDHIQGFPFFSPGFVPGNRFAVYGQGRSSDMLEGILEGQVNPNFSPLHTIRNLGASFDLQPLYGGNGEAAVVYEGVRILARKNPHGHTTCLAFRLEAEGRVLVYAPDVGYPDEGPSAEMRALYEGADTLIHDATYTPEDRARRRDRGYSSYQDAAEVALAARARRLVLFHYDQDYSDSVVDQCWTRCRHLLDEQPGGAAIELIAAQEGLTLAW